MPGLLVLLTQVPSVAFVTVQPLLLRRLLDDGILAGNGRVAAWSLAGIVGLLAANALGDFGNQYLVTRTGVRLMNDLRRRIFGHLQELSLAPCLMLALDREAFQDLLRAAPDLRARVEEIAGRRREAQAGFR
jgi:ABC-type multidrug transport system fused ATPase/permease subunit